jgi:tetratricopeptide (TPR) repeat protein
MYRCDLEGEMPGAGDHTAPALLSNDGMKRESLIARAVDWVFGYDFFLSYSHGDGMRLPRRLKERLEQAGFRVFLDQTEYVAGADLRRETRRQVVKSRKVVVIGRPCALKSEWVRREVDVALAHDKIPVILNINGAVESAAADAALATMARERHWLRLTETLDDPDGEPPDRTVTELVRGFNHTRQETKRQRIFAIAAAVLAITAGIATWQAVEATRARTVAEAERDRAQRVLAQVVGNANRRVEALSQRVKRERESVRVGQARPIPVSLPEPTSRSPLQLANDLIAKATTLLASGDLRGARSPFEQALQIIESSKEGQSGEPEWQLARFSLYNGLAKAALAAGDPDGALAALTKSLAVAEARVAVEPAALEWRQKRAVLHQRMGELHLEQGRLVEAGQEYQEAIALWRELASVPELLPRARRELAFALAQRGDLELKRSNSRMALTLYQESVSLLEQLTGSGTPGTDLQRELSVGYQQIADALLAAGRADEALVWADKDLAVIQGAVADGASQQRDLASSYDRRARALGRLGRDAEALASYDKGTALIEAAILASDAEPSWHRDAAAMLESTGKLLQKTGQQERALRAFRRALSLREGIAALETEWQGEVEAAYWRISAFMRSIGRDDQALETAEQYLLAASFAADMDLAKAERIARALGSLSWSALLAGNVPRALWAGRHAVALAPKLDWLKRNHAHALMLSGKTDQAKEIYLGTGALSSEPAQQWQSEVLKDFADMKKRRIGNSLMAEIAARFNVSDK